MVMKGGHGQKCQIRGIYWSALDHATRVVLSCTPVDVLFTTLYVWTSVYILCIHKRVDKCVHFTHTYDIVLNVPIFLPCNICQLKLFSALYMY